MAAIPGATSGGRYADAEPGTALITKDGRKGKSLVFEPWAYDWCAKEMLRETGRCRLLMGASFVGAEMRQERIEEIRAQYAGEELAIRAKVYVDGTGDGILCVAAGCPWRVGEDPRSLHRETLAPKQPKMRLNAMTLIYRIKDTGARQQPWLPPGVPDNYCTGGLAMCQMPNGDRVVNHCGMLTGDSLDPLSFPALLAEARRRVRAHLHWMQTKNRHETWSLAGIAPQLGIRESRRMVGDYVLTEHDFRVGLSGQKHPDIIAACDHSLDMHGAGGFAAPPPNGALGVPYRCLLPQQADNLLVACRALSCSHVASSSVRLQRTLMKIGEAAGVAAAMAARQGLAPRQVDVKALQSALDIERTIERCLAQSPRVRPDKHYKIQL